MDLLLFDVISPLREAGKTLGIPLAAGTILAHTPQRLQRRGLSKVLEGQGKDLDIYSQGRASPSPPNHQKPLVSLKGCIQAGRWPLDNDAGIGLDIPCW